MRHNIEDVAKHGIQKLYSIEGQLFDALKMLEAMAEDGELRQAFADHRQETQVHILRLEQICNRMGWSAIGIPSQTVIAMKKETLEDLNGAEKCPTTDAMLIAAGRQSEHLEISSYSSAIGLAKELGDIETASLLEQTLAEEQKADEKLTQIAADRINRNAAAYVA